MSESKLRTLSMDFAVQIISLVKSFKKEDQPAKENDVNWMQLGAVRIMAMLAVISRRRLTNMV